MENENNTILMIQNIPESLLKENIIEIEEQPKKATISRNKLSNRQRLYNILVASLSSISFGYGLTSFGVISNVMNSNSTNYESSLLTLLSTIAVSNIFLGGLIANFFVRIFPGIRRKHLLIISSVINCFSYVFQFIFPQIVTVSITRIFIGISSGLVCAVVPGFLYDNSSKRLSGFIPSIHSIGISVGILIGGLFGIWNNNEMYHFPMYAAVFYFFINTFLLLFIKETKIEQEEMIKHVGVLPLLRMKNARKSLLISTIFHLTQHLSGVDFVAMFSSRVMGSSPNYFAVYLSSMALAIPIGLLSSILLDKVGRKPMMLISCAFLFIVTLLMGLVDLYNVLIFFFVVSYNLGVSNVPWTLPTEIFPKDCFKSGNMIGITVNWFSAYLLSIFAGAIYEVFHDYLWFFFATSMACVFTYSVFFLKETKNIPIPQFQ